MLLIYPPVAKACEPPAGIARLAGALRGSGYECSLIDMNLEGQFFLLDQQVDVEDTWSQRALKNRTSNVQSLRSVDLYHNFSRYQRAVADVNRVVDRVGRQEGVSLSLANYQENLSPLKSADLLESASHPEKNIFHKYFSKRLQSLLNDNSSAIVGFSLNYLSQAICTFAMIGFLRKRYPDLQIVVGGGLVTSWLRNPAWENLFGGLIDHLIAGPGEKPLLDLLGRAASYHAPDYSGLPLAEYLSPGIILPYAASSGCWWNRCSFCPETAEGNPYVSIEPEQVLQDIQQLSDSTKPTLIHFLDNAVSPALMKKMIERPPGVAWYGFARVTLELTDVDFCRSLKQSGCLMLKLGLESGDQEVLDAMHKGIDLEMVSRALDCLKEAGIATYVYLLFGTPSETVEAARRTLEFTVRHSEAITFLNLAIFNMPICGEDAHRLGSGKFYDGDLSLYTDFDHPLGWHRGEVRRFLDQEFKRHSDISKIIQRDPPLFTSNHAPFFCCR